MIDVKQGLVFMLCVMFASFTQAFRPKLLGKVAPVFTGQAVFPDGSIKDFDLRDYIGKFNIVLYFYPFDNTPQCSLQAQSFKDSIVKLKQAGIMVIGVSCDAPQSHKRFQKKLGLPYPLVSDERIKRTISKMYGTLGLFHSKRRTFLISKKGIVIKVFDEVDIATQIEDILKGFKESDSLKVTTA